jgi:3-oxoacyl-[acyl-carrier protein] reductase
MTTPNTLPLAGKAALVTGASRGIGAAVARRLAADGADVAITYNTGKAEAEAIVGELAALGRHAIAIAADLAEPAAAATVVNTAFDELRHLDIVVNNAGITYWRPISKTSLEDIDHVFALDARAPYLVTQAAAEKIADGGRIINISSGVTGVAIPGSSLYSAAKAFVEQMTAVAAFELAGRRITVNAIAPGTTATSRWASLPEEHRQQRIQSFALGRVGEPEDAANVVAFLASAAGGWITGQTIHATGGES